MEKKIHKQIYEKIRERNKVNPTGEIYIWKKQIKILRFGRCFLLWASPHLHWLILLSFKGTFFSFFGSCFWGCFALDFTPSALAHIVELLWLWGLERIFCARQDAFAALRRLFAFGLASRLLPWRASSPWWERGKALEEWSSPRTLALELGPLLTPPPIGGMDAFSFRAHFGVVLGAVLGIVLGPISARQA